MLSTSKSRSLKRDKVNKLFVIVAAAGLGHRFGGSNPKQFCMMDGVSPLRKTVDLFLSLDFISGVICVIPDGFRENYNSIVKGINDDRLIDPVIGGDKRSDSVRNGLKAIKRFEPDYVLIHDAARCYCKSDVVKRVCEKLLNGAKAVVPTISSTDSVRYNGIGVDRTKVEFSQTPQGFGYDLILNLHEKYKGQTVTDDAALCDLEGIRVESVHGDVKNKKITFKSDVEQIIYRTGCGYDAHRFSDDPKRKLFIMGKEISDHKGLDGISDADVGIHSLVDAILGALCLGDIGQHFPANDPKNKGVDSKNFLLYCKDLLNERNAEITNIDATIICESPRISKYSDEMRKIVANCLGISESIVNIKGKTTEGMGFEGRKEGISAMTVVTIRFSL